MNILENNMDIIEKMVPGTNISAAEDGAKNSITLMPLTHTHYS